jgi:hypothetical protein
MKLCFMSEVLQEGLISKRQFVYFYVGLAICLSVFKYGYIKIQIGVDVLVFPLGCVWLMDDIKRDRFEACMFHNKLFPSIDTGCFVHPI